MNIPEELEVAIAGVLGIFSAIGLMTAGIATLSWAHDQILPLYGEHAATAITGGAVGVLFGLPVVIWLLRR